MRCFFFIKLSYYYYFLYRNCIIDKSQQVFTMCVSYKGEEDIRFPLFVTNVWICSLLDVSVCVFCCFISFSLSIIYYCSITFCVFRLTYSKAHEIQTLVFICCIYWCSTLSNNYQDFTTGHVHLFRNIKSFKKTTKETESTFKRSVLAYNSGPEWRQRKWTCCPTGSILHACADWRLMKTNCPGLCRFWPGGREAGRCSPRGH